MSDFPETHRKILLEFVADLRTATLARVPQEIDAIEAALLHITRLERQTKLYGRELDEWAEKETRVCGEDVSFVDRIKWLEGEIARLQRERSALLARCEDGGCGACGHVAGERCPSVGPAPESFRCGLPVGHSGHHTALIETGAPWSTP